MAPTVVHRFVWLLSATIAVLLLVGCGGSSSRPTTTAQLEPVQQPQETSPTANAIEVPANAAIAPQPAPPARAANAKKVVVLDPGHGGEEVGSARQGVVES